MKNQILIFMMKCRNFFIQNFFVNVICSIKSEKNWYINRIITHKYNFYSRIIRVLLRLVPFFIIKHVFNYFDKNVIYQIDNIYYISNCHQNRISPIIMNLEFINENNKHPNICNLTNKIKFYNSSIPISFLIKQYNLESYNLIKLKYLKKGTFIEKTIKYDINWSPHYIYNLFD